MKQFNALGLEDSKHVKMVTSMKYNICILEITLGILCW